MCAIVDGYKLYSVTGADNSVNTVAGVGNRHVCLRSFSRGIFPKKVIWHPKYREYANTENIHAKARIRSEIEDLIITDVAEFDD